MTLTAVCAGVLLGAVLCATLGAEAAEAAPLAPAAAAAWQQWLTPLPKQVELTGKVTVPLSALRLTLPPQPTDLDRALAEELSSALAEKSQHKVDLTAAGGSAQIVFRRPGAAQALLDGKRNGEQGYLLTSAEAGGKVTATCEALTAVGSYYGGKTLKQLLLASLRGEGGAATVDLPLGRILDWPDLEERGQWGGTCTEDLEWLSDLKFNLIELHARLSVGEDKVGHAAMDAEVMARARRHAVRIVPIIHHLEQLQGTGMFKAFPQLEAVDAKVDNPNIRAVCFSRPEIVTLVSQWLVELGRLPDVSEVMIWLSEEGKGCQCAGCKPQNRFVAELNAVTAAWHEAQKTCPRLGLRVLLTQTSYASNDQVLAALQPGVKVSYYHGGLTYNTERKPMIYPLLADYVKGGKWLGVYPTLCANWLSVAPFTNPEFTHYRLTEFVDKGLQNLVGYIVPTDRYYQVNTAGSLEWAWNAHGRSVEEFTTAWAVRQGLKDPAQFVAWTKLIGPPAWDMYASGFPYLENWGTPLAQIAAGKMKFALGQSLFTAFTTEEQFGTNVAQCERALALAQELGEPQFIEESRIILGYSQVLQAVWELSRLLRGQEKLAAEARPAAEKWFRQCQGGVDTLVAAYPLWNQACCPTVQGKAPERFSSTLSMMEKFGAAMSDLMEKQGFADEGKPYRLHVIGAWKTEDFVPVSARTQRLEVSPLIAGTGTYQFRPAYRGGSLGLVVSSVSLVSYPKDKPEEVREEAVDKHSCHAGAWVKDDLYLLELKAYDAARGYAVVASFSGGDSTTGEFLFRKVRQ